MCRQYTCGWIRTLTFFFFFFFLFRGHEIVFRMLHLAITSIDCDVKKKKHKPLTQFCPNAGPSAAIVCQSLGQHQSTWCVCTYIWNKRRFFMDSLKSDWRWSRDTWIKPVEFSLSDLVVYLQCLPGEGIPLVLWCLTPRPWGGRVGTQWAVWHNKITTQWERDERVRESGSGKTTRSARREVLCLIKDSARSVTAKSTRCPRQERQTTTEMPPGSWPRAPTSSPQEKWVRRVVAVTYIRYHDILPANTRRSKGNVGLMVCRRRRWRAINNPTLVERFVSAGLFCKKIKKQQLLT